MAATGPVPKRSNQRRRRDSPDAIPLKTGAGDPDFQPDPANSKWHPVAKRWYESLARSGQSSFYEPSDWATAWMLAETMSRELRPRYVGFNEKTGEVVKVDMPISGSSLTAILKGMNDLVITEGARRRMRIELAPRGVGDGRKTGGSVSWLDEARRKSG